MRSIVQGFRRWIGRPGVRLGLLLVAVFVAGATVGAALDRMALRRAGGIPLLLQQPRASDPDRIVARMQRNLDLDEAQAAMVRAVLERRQPQIRATWAGARETLLAQVDSTLAEIASILTPEQREKARARLRRVGADRPVIDALLKERRPD